MSLTRHFPLNGPMSGNVTECNRIRFADWLHIYLIDTKENKKIRDSDIEQILEIVLYQTIDIFCLFQDIFPLRRPIPENVTESKPIPVAVWLHIYLIDKNV